MCVVLIETINQIFKCIKKSQRSFDDLCNRFDLIFDLFDWNGISQFLFVDSNLSAVERFPSESTYTKFGQNKKSSSI